MEEISLEEIFYLIKNKIKFIMGIILMFIIISGVFSFYIITPEYETFTTLMVGKPKDYQTEDPIDYDDLMLNQKLVHTYGVLVKSRDVSDQVIENLNLKLDYEEFGKKVNVNLVEDTEIIKIEVRDKNPKLATRIANETAKVFMASVKNFMKVENIQVIDKAQVPKRPIKPKPLLNISIAAVLGLMISIFIILLMEFLDNTIKDPDDIEEKLNMNLMGVIPKFKNEKIVTLENPKSPISESYRTIRTNIEFSNIDEKIKTISVTSSIQGEGKSTLVSNLASTMAQANKNVLIIDADLRRPRISKIFNIEKRQGLTNLIIKEDLLLEDLVYRNKNIDNLSILSSGPIPPNPSELLSSDKMKKIINKAKEEYDFIIIDTPPIKAVTDGAIISTLVDSSIIVVESGETDIRLVRESKEQLEKVNANILGVVINKVSRSNNMYYDKYGYYQYSYYLDE